MIEARMFHVTGRVQGVGFRLFAYEVAIREGLNGFVRNLPDGSVEAVVEGDAEALARFHAALWRGPAGSRVEAVEPQDLQPAGRHHGFSITGSF